MMRRVMVVLPEPVPPQMPMTRVLLGEGMTLSNEFGGLKFAVSAARGFWFDLRGMVRAAED